jgi:hypothetical protein
MLWGFGIAHADTAVQWYILSVFIVADAPIDPLKQK